MTESIFKDRLEYMNSQSKTSLMALLVVGCLIAYAFYGLIDSLTLFLWLFANFLVVALRYFIHKSYPSYVRLNNLESFYTLFFIGTASNAVVWGAGVLFLFSYYSQTYQMFLASIYGGIAAASMVSLGVFKRIYITYVLIYMLPLSYVIVLHGDKLSYTIVTVFLIFILFLILVSSRYEKIFIDGAKSKYENLKLNEEIENTQREIIFTIGAVGERRCKETGRHVARVAEYSKLLATKYGLDKESIGLIEEASPLHDIGKVAVPDNILNKPDKLTNEEFEIIKKHSQDGYEMLKHSDRMLLKTASKIALYHHEKWDGSGYPSGLIGEQIPICARIVALADVFDALGTDRVYKKAMPDEEVFEIIRAGRGSHFEPKLVDIFFENLKEFLAIRDKLRD